MPNKDGDDDEKTTKGVVKKKTKQMLNQEYIPEEEYDRYRDNILMRGGDHRSKETKERSYTPTGKQPKGQTAAQKAAKGKSALELVKADITKKYGKGAIMDVKKKSKKKANEELDLTKIAEAFGGYILEKAVVTSDADRETNTYNPRKRGRVLSRREIENRETARQNRYGPTGRDINKKYGVPPVGSTGSQYTVQPGEEEATKELLRKFATTGTGTGSNIPDFPKNLTGKQFKDFMDRQMGRTLDIETNTREQSKKAGEKLKNQQDRVTSGDERSTDKPIITGDIPKRSQVVTGGQDRTTDTAFQPFRPEAKPETETETKKRVKRVKPKKQKVIVKQKPKTKTKTEPQTQTQTAVGGGGRRGGPRVTTSGGAFSGKEPSLVSKVAKFSKENPATALLSLDALRRFMPSSSPFGVSGGRVGRRSAPS